MKFHSYRHKSCDEGKVVLKIILLCLLLPVFHTNYHISQLSFNCDSIFFKRLCHTTSLTANEIHFEIYTFLMNSSILGPEKAYCIQDMHNLTEKKIACAFSANGVQLKGLRQIYLF